MRAPLLLAWSMMGLAACPGNSPKGERGISEATTVSDDERLIASVRAAARAAIEPGTVEAEVGRAALVNTATGLPLDALGRVDFQPDPEHADERLDLARARAVVYWARPGESADPRVVGVWFDDAGAATVFFATILPP